MTTSQDQDVLDLLLDQHQQIKDLFGQVKSAAGTQKRDKFQELVRLLAMHETAEEEIVHPSARANAGDQVVDERLHEEDEAKHVLAELYDMGVDAPGFDDKFAKLADAVVDHATHEEQDEFAKMRDQRSADELRRMAGIVRAAEAVAPTRPHPQGGESATANLLVGPPLAVFDRIKDAVRDMRQSDS
ncbi:hemerythrin domain-containing protein [Skermania sp. ID1734]|uniref:hemerythrin domain-containing protein n=1 Tax=Skermania sp. ID1734 TaxID=2597516 RepID=UPI001180B94E|nr:hemerythrin domain-containing protein [Skermania sp. ID1734]TSD95384.1 hemerythrin domain-containing protein [Skermania sp. ID1734]